MHFFYEMELITVLGRWCLLLLLAQSTKCSHALLAQSLTTSVKKAPYMSLLPVCISHL